MVGAKPAAYSRKSRLAGSRPRAARRQHCRPRMKFGRQIRPAGPSASPPAAVPTGHVRPMPATPIDVISVPKASPLGTQLALVGIAITALFLTGKTPTDLGRFAAIGVGASLA